MRIRLAIRILLAVSSPCWLAAQQTSGVLRGFVTDASGAAIAKATVTLTNSDSGAVQSATTDAAGSYSFPLLPPGVYSAAAQANGFERVIRDRVVVRITETERVDFSLPLGSLNQSVTVSGGVTLVQTDSASEGRVIERESIETLPLSTRNFTQLLGLTAGVTTSPVNAESIGYGSQNPNVNGMRGGSNNYLLDGAMNNNSMNNATAGIGAPSVDFLQEFKVITNLYSAEYGRNAGSVVNVVTRSGTDSFHSGLFEFLRNTDLVARPFFGLQRGQNVQNQFGASIGGPVTIPRIYRGKDRTFFFFGYEGLRQRNTNSTAAALRGVVPTVPQRQGIFATSIKDPSTGALFPDNTIPAARINATATQLLQQFVPLPNVDIPRFNYVLQIGTPFDGNQYIYRIDHTISSADRLMAREFMAYSHQSSGNGLLPGFGNIQSFTNRQLALSETHTFRPNLLNEFRFDYYNYINPSNNANWSDPRSVGIQPMNPEPGIPGMLVNGYISYGYTGNNYKDQISSFIFDDTLSNIVGSHIVKYGAEIRANHEQSFGIPFQGRFTFNGQYTGNALADFLLGGPSQLIVANGPGKVDMRDDNFDLFVQDDWKVTHRLTLNLGLRYEYNRPVTETLVHQLLNFYPSLYQGAGANSGLVTGGVTPGVAPATYYSDWTNFAPRFSFAYTPGSYSRTVIRGGYGIFFDTAAGQITQQNLSQPPYAGSQTVAFSPNAALNGFGYPAPVDLSHPTVTAHGGSLTIHPIQEHMGSPYAAQWNFGLQHQFRSDWSVEAAYLGTRGRQLFMVTNINYPQGPGLVRPYDGFSSILWMGSGLNSDYNSFQYTAQKRLSHGLGFLAAYTFSKSIDEASGADRYFTQATGDPANLEGSRGLSSFDRTHRVVVSYNWRIPNPFGASAKGLARVLNNWELSGITTMQSGTPFSVNNPQSNLDHDGDAGAPGSGGRADVVYGVRAINPGPNSSKLNNYLNPAAFAPAPRSRFGTLGRDTLRGPGSNLWDGRVSKTARLNDRINLRFLTEFFNIWNHASFANPATSLGAVNFGTISSTLSNARIIQFALKLEY